MRASTACLGVLLLVGCGAGMPDHVPIDPALGTLVPPDTVLLAGVRLDHLREVPGFERLFEEAAPVAFREFIRDTGLNPAEDVWEVLFASNGAENVLMVRGRFSATGLEPRFEREGARRMPYRGYMMIGDDDAAVLFMNASTALLGTPELLQSIVDGRDRFSGIPEALMARLATIDYASQIWAVSVGRWPRTQFDVGNWGNLLGVLSRVEGLTLSTTLNGVFSLLVQADCSSEEEAESLLTNVRALLALTRFATAEKPAAAALLDSVGLLRKEGRVELSANLASELLLDLAE